MGSDTQSFYESPGERLSQGDVILSIPWGLVEAPLRICRPHQGDQTPEAAKAPFGPPEKFSDAFKRPKSNNKEIVFAYGERGKGLVLWHGCQIDKFEELKKKPESWFAGVVPILEISNRLQPQDREAVESGTHRSFFYLPGNDEASGNFPDSFVDLRHIWPIKQSLLTERVLTLREHVRLSLYNQLFTFLTRLRLNHAAPCPHCSNEVPLDAFVQDVGETG